VTESLLQIGIYTVAEQNATIAQQQKGMEAVMARLNEQAAQIRKVSAQLELNKPAPQTVVNNQ
jgi:cell division protein FtsB